MIAKQQQIGATNPVPKQIVVIGAGGWAKRYAKALKSYVERKECARDMIGNGFEMTKDITDQGQVVMGGCWLSRRVGLLPSMRPMLILVNATNSLGFE